MVWPHKAARTFKINASLAACVFLCLFCATGTSYAGAVNNPDINRDGKINAIDIQLVTNASLGMNIGGLNADIDGNGRVDAVDVQLVINASRGMDIFPPSGNIKINNGGATTSSIIVTLSLSARDNTGGTGISKMSFSNDGRRWSTPESYSTIKRGWRLFPQAPPRKVTEKKVYVKFSDRAGNWSSPYAAGILLIDSGQFNKEMPTDVDINEDGKIDAVDIQLAINAALGISIGGLNADVNRDGVVDAVDVQLVINTALGLDTSPPFPPTINPLTSPLIVNHVVISGAKPSDAVAVVVTCPTATIGAPRYPTTTTWGCELTNLTFGANNVSVKAKDASGNESTAANISVDYVRALSISANPKLWNAGSLMVNRTTTMLAANKITVTNNGNGPEAMELKVISPSGWIAATSPAREKYVLSGLFCNNTDIPQAGDFNQDASTEDTVLADSRRATSTIFGYTRATANGAQVPAGSSRALYLQFKSPTVTSKKDEQSISVIITCQIP